MDHLNQFFGKAVEVVTKDNVVYRGNLKSIDGNDKKIVLKNIRDCTNGKQLRSEKHFFGDQIQDLKILDKVTIPDDSKENHIRNEESQQKWMDASDQGTSLFQMGHLQPSMYMNGLEDTIKSVNFNSPPKATLITHLDKSYFQACSDIGEQKVISMVVDGWLINRFGDISLLTIGTRQMIYIFDLYTIGEDAFAKGLMSIIENPNILKVCHDIRMISDCLQTKYHVKPINIFDTQVADAFIHKNENHRFPEKVSSLTDCILKHLRLKEEDVTFEYEKKVLIKDNKNIWAIRPLNEEIQKLCARQAMYLRELRTIMLEKLLADFLHGVDIYLKHFREQSDSAIKFADLNKLPKDFKKFVNENEKRSKFPQRQCDNRNKHHEEEYDDSDSSHAVSETRRSAWDTGSKFTEQYHEKHGEIVESLGKSCSMIDDNKPLLRKTNSPKTETVQNGRPSRINNFDTKSEQSTKKDDRLTNQPMLLAQPTKPIDWKSHVGKFQSRGGNYDEFQFSTTSDSDDSYLVSNQTDEYNMDEIEDLMKLEMKKANDNPYEGDNNTNDVTTSRPRIGNAAKLMITNNLDLSTIRNERQPLTYLSSSPASSVDINEYPSIQESIDIQSFLKSTKNNFNFSKKREKIVKDSKSQKVSTNTTPKPRGRGQILKSLTEQSRLKTPSPGFSEIGAPRHILSGDSNNVYDFPSDEELLDTPHVVPAISGARMVGENVSVLKKHMK